jgi:hypothetical protein
LPVEYSRQISPTAATILEAGETATANVAIVAAAIPHVTTIRGDTLDMSAGITKDVAMPTALTIVSAKLETV